MIKTQFTLSVATIQASVVERFGYHISYTKASKSKHKTLKVFQRVFWAFHPSIEGFKHCCPVLTIDGTHLYGKYKGTVMIVMSCDGNNQLFPLAFALTEDENVDSWGWFLACIRNRVTQRRGLCVISDRHPSIMAAFADVYLGWSEPNAYHRIYMRHLASNFMTRFKDKCLKQLLCRAALETKVEKFNIHMETIWRINQDALSWLEDISFEKWTLSHDGSRRYGIMTTNMSEVFNSVLKRARSFPITAFVQLTFYRVNNYFAVRREHGASRLALGKQHTSYVDAKMNANVDVKMNANVVKASSHEDVAMILGLRIHEPPITGTCNIDWSLLCSELLGVDDVILQRYACAFILALLGGALFANKTGTHCWHSYIESYVVRVWIVPQRFLDLSHFYSCGDGRDFMWVDLISVMRQLPVDPLGHRWRIPLSWSHNPSPHVLTFYRDQLDAQTQDRVLWEPYTANLIAHLPTICQADEEIWRTMSPLICFDIIVWHKLERVLPQFRMQQGIPPPCLIDMELYLVDRRGRHQYDWVTFHAQYISLWVTRSERIATTLLVITTMAFYDPYMQWYRRIMRRLIAPVLHRDHMRFHSIASATELLPIDLDPRLPYHLPLPPVQPSISLDAPPPIIESIAPPPVTESIAPLPFLQGTTHAARLHVRVPRGHQAPRVRRVLPPSVPSNSTTHVDDVSWSIEMRLFR
ncbi:Serine/threonine-protein phosphatase 7 long form-like [Vitis vinifera]|uniref:Serine/threonine-protein phosphatase 7 long form-like n=1 Tax=Vitis vinifera TaxID=29760 RepID=A0A438FG72_VITVI|nr:Serine/threonine-protein phosphatase 7 long form-like [Vitis vinifera]